MGGTSSLIPPLPEEVTEASYKAIVGRLGLGALPTSERVKALVEMDAQELFSAIGPSGPLLPSIGGVVGSKSHTYADIYQGPSGPLDLPGRQWCDAIMIGDCQMDASILRSHLLSGNTYKSGQAFIYQFNEPNTWDGPWKGHANHILDVAYLFQNFNEHLSEAQRAAAVQSAKNVIAFCNGNPPWAAFRWEVGDQYSRVYGGRDETTSGKIFTVLPTDLCTDRSDPVLTLMRKADQVRQVYLDPATGVIAATETPKRVILECSTIDSQPIRAVAEALLRVGAGGYVDIPVSGGVPAAELGTLSFLIGHTKPSDTDPISYRLEKIATMMGDPHKFFFCGKLGAGLAAKSAKPTSRVRSYRVQSVPGVVPHAPSSNDYRLGFKTQMMTKDLTLSVQAGHATGITPSIAAAALHVYEKAAADLQCIDRDGSSVYLHLTNPPKGSAE
ncbi:hypothetical protein BDV12DRAFT_200513 [Aspergillus spectabilis]